MPMSIEEFNAAVNDGLEDKFGLIIGNWMTRNELACKNPIEANMLTTSLLQAVEASIVNEFRK